MIIMINEFIAFMTMCFTTHPFLTTISVIILLLVIESIISSLINSIGKILVARYKNKNSYGKLL
jgi:hypothetical protein